MARRIVPGACNMCNDIYMHLQSMQLHVSPSHVLPTASPRPLGRLGLGSWSCCAASLFLDGLDVSMVGMALPVHRRRPRPDDLAAAVDRVGLRARLRRPAAARRPRRRPARPPARRCSSRSAVFTVASALGGLVDDGTLLVVTRFLKGAAAAFTAPAGPLDHHDHFAEGPTRNRALSIYTARGASGFSLGLVLGGLLTELGWRWTFLLPVPFALALLALGPARDPARPRRARRRAGASTSPAR